MVQVAKMFAFLPQGLRLDLRHSQGFKIYVILISTKIHSHFHSYEADKRLPAPAGT